MKIVVVAVVAVAAAAAVVVVVEDWGTVLLHWVHPLALHYQLQCSLNEHQLQWLKEDPLVPNWVC